jgi:hypothetical protein
LDFFGDFFVKTFRFSTRFFGNFLGSAFELTLLRNTRKRDKTQKPRKS